MWVPPFFNDLQQQQKKCIKSYSHTSLIKLVKNKNKNWEE